MHYTHRLGISSIALLPALLVLLGFAFVASADGGQTTYHYQPQKHEPAKQYQQQSPVQTTTNITYTLTVTGLRVMHGMPHAYAAEKDKDTQQHTYTTTLSNKNEVPLVPKDAHGDAKVEFKGGDGENMKYWIKFSNPGDPVTEGHFHCAPPGVNGPVVVGLFKFPQGQEMKDYIIDGNVQSDHIAPTGKDCKDTIGYSIYTMKDLVRAIKEGKIYINVHSKAYPNGVARGQLTQHHDSSYGGYYGGGYDKKDEKKDDYKHDKKDDKNYHRDDSWKKDDSDKDYDKKKDDYKHDDWKKDEGKDWNKDDWKKDDDKKHEDKDWNKDEWKKDDGKDWNKDDWKNDDRKDWNKDTSNWHTDDGKKDWNNDWNSDKHDWNNDRSNW